MITTGMSGSQDAQNAEQVGDRASAQGEDRGQGKEDEPTMDRPRERRLEGVEDRPNLLGKLIVNPFKPPPRDTGLACLLTPRGTESSPDLLLGEACGAGRLNYPWESPCVRCGGWSTPTTSPKRLAVKTRKKRQKSS